MNEIDSFNRTCYGSLRMHLLRCLPLLCCLVSTGSSDPHNSGSGHEVATVEIRRPEEGMMDCRVLVENVAQMSAALVNDNHHHHRNITPQL